MLIRPKTWCALAGAVVLTLSATGCAQIVPRLGLTETDPTTDPALAAASPTVTVKLATDQSGAPQAPVTSSGPLGPQNIAVRKGAIDLQMTMSGRVAGTEEAEIVFPGGGKVDVIGVKSGDTVKQGQLLLQTETTDIEKDLKAAQARLETAGLRLQQAQAQGQAQRNAQQRDAAKRASDEAARRQQAMQDAQINLRKAQDNFDRVAAGASSTEKRIAEATVATAQATLNKAQADLDRLNKGANPDDVRAAERAVASAQTNVDTATAEVDRLTRGPDPAVVRSAERDVERAQTALKVAQATKADGTNVTQTQRDALIANAQLSLQDAEDRLAKAKQPSDPRDLAIAQRNLQVARTALDQAKERFDIVKKGPDQATLDAAQQTVDAAQSALDNAQDKLDETNSHPTLTELRAARDGVDQAQAALTRASTPSNTDVAVDDSGAAFDMEIMEKGLAQEQATVATLEKKLDDTKLLAPYAAVVTSVNVRVGDTVDPAHSAFTLAKPGAPVVRMDVTEQDAAKLKVDQSANVVLDGSDAALKGTIVSLAASTGSSGKVAQIRVEWGSGEQPKVGRTAQVTVVLQHKENVLLVPKKAVRVAGARQYVQYMSGTSRRIANVEVGITNDQDAEITNGLIEGQIIVVGP
ncbi:MAG TPA: HlyD family efflux transporter periplasmic adaptor subunit [Chloroflexota bacterium]